MSVIYLAEDWHIEDSLRMICIFSESGSDWKFGNDVDKEVKKSRRLDSNFGQCKRKCSSSSIVLLLQDKQAIMLCSGLRWPSNLLSYIIKIPCLVTCEPLGSWQILGRCKVETNQVVSTWTVTSRILKSECFRHWPMRLQGLTSVTLKRRSNKKSVRYVVDPH